MINKDLLKEYKRYNIRVLDRDKFMSKWNEIPVVGAYDIETNKHPMYSNYSMTLRERFKAVEALGEVHTEICAISFSGDGADGKEYTKYYLGVEDARIIAFMYKVIPSGRIIGFNNSRFDNHFIINLFKDIPEAEIMIFSPKKHDILYVIIEYKGKVWAFQDLARVLPGTLDSNLKMINAEVQKGTTYDYSKIRKTKSDFSKSDIEYIINDTLGLWQLTKSMNETTIKELGLSITDYLTAGSLVTKYFRERLEQLVVGGNHPLSKLWDEKKYRCNKYARKYSGETPFSYFLENYVFPKPEALKQEYGKTRDGYFGGLCYSNPREKGKILNNVHSIDANSMYPAQMSKHLPYGKPRLIKVNNATSANIKSAIERYKLANGEDQYFMIYLTEATGSIKSVPSMLYTRRNGITYKRRSITPSMKLNVLDNFNIEHVSITSGKCVIKVFKTIEMFKDIISEAYKLKSEAKHPAVKAFAKLLLNSSYGKFGQYSDTSVKAVINHDGYVDYVSEETDVMYNWYTYMPVACSITSQARSDLYKHIEVVRGNGDEVVYCDTDSIKFYGPTEPKNLKGIEIHPKKLGAYDHEYTYDRFFTMGKKYYVTETDGKVSYTISGVKTTTQNKQEHIENQYVNEYSFDEFHDKIMCGGLISTTASTNTKHGRVIVDYVEKKVLGAMEGYYDN